MKIFQLILLAGCMLFVFSACDYDSFDEEEALSELEFVNPFVRFATGAVGGVITVPVTNDTAVASITFDTTIMEIINDSMMMVMDTVITADSTFVRVNNPNVGVTVENFANVGGDLNVNYDISGTAVAGEDYALVDNPDNMDGSIFIPFENVGGGTAVTTGGISFRIIPDTLPTGPKTIIVTLTDVDSETGTDIDAGQGPLRKELTINLVND